MKPDLAKVTVEIRSETVAALDKLAIDELLGSRGRAIDWLVRRYLNGVAALRSEAEGDLRP